MAKSRFAAAPAAEPKASLLEMLEDASYEFHNRIGMLIAIALAMQSADPLGDKHLEEELWRGIYTSLRDLRGMVGDALKDAEGAARCARGAAALDDSILADHVHLAEELREAGVDEELVVPSAHPGHGEAEIIESCERVPTVTPALP